MSSNVSFYYKLHCFPLYILACIYSIYLVIDVGWSLKSPFHLESIANNIDFDDIMIYCFIKKFIIQCLLITMICCFIFGRLQSSL